ISLQGNFARTDLAGLQGGGATVQVVNSGNTGLDLGGGTLALTAASGSLTTGSNGRIRNGTVQTSGGATFNLTTNSILDNLVLDTDASATNATVRIENSLGIAGGRRLTLANSDLLFQTTAGQSLYRSGGSGNAEVFLTGSSSDQIYYNVNSGSLTVGNGIWIHGNQTGYVYSNASGGSLINNGLIDADTAGKALNVGYSNAFTNGPTGVLRASGGNLFVGSSFSNTTWTNQNTSLGSIDASGSGSINLQGNFALADLTGLQGGGATLQVVNSGSTGLNLGGGTLALNATTGSLAIGSSGRIRNGTVQTSGGAAFGLTTNSILDNLVLDTDASATNATVRVENNLGIAGGRRLTLNNSDLLFQTTAGQSLYRSGGSGNAEVYLSGSSSDQIYYNVNSGSLTIGSGIRIHGDQTGYVYSNSAGGSLINNGLIDADTAGKALNVGYSNTFINGPTGVLRASGGNLFVGSSFSNTAWSNQNTNLGSIDASASGNISLQGNFTLTDLTGLQGGATTVQ
ncbi:MAG: hypothetical protein JNJ60_20285, partial [Rhodocyclaceae bacterium]|nr:hypothetical protein [Rhodocyclaceae bacterium]